MNYKSLWYFRVTNPSAVVQQRIKNVLSKSNTDIKFAHYQLESNGYGSNFMHGYIDFTSIDDIDMEWFKTNFRKTGQNEYKPVFLVGTCNINNRLSNYYKIEGPWSHNQTIIS